MREETVNLNGQPFLVRHWGEHNTDKILMLHGFPEYGGAWAELAERLSERYHCIAPDQRGYGRSWAPEGEENYGLSSLVGDMSALIGQDKVIVLGHDWGASVAYGLAIFCPDQVEKLIIMNGVHPAPFIRALAAGGAQAEASQYITFLRADGSEDRLAKDDFALLIKMFSAKMDMSWFDAETMTAYKTEWARPGRMHGMVNWYRASNFHVPEPGKTLSDLPDPDTDKFSVHCPHLLIWGQDDAALLPEATEGLEDYAADLTRVEIAGADHWLHHQKPDEVARIIQDWLAR